MKFLVSTSMALIALGANPASADKLDDIISSGTLRCAVVLDFPPMGSRDADNNPIGFDVDYCNDLAKSLGVTAEIVETPFPDRVPALMSDRADVIVGGTSDTLERAKTIGFSVPYFAFEMVLLTKKDSGIKTWEDMKGKNLGAISGTFQAVQAEKDVNAWGSGAFRGYQTQNDTIQAVDQGHIDGSIDTSTVVAATLASGNYPNLAMGPKVPYPIDYVALGAAREEYGFLNYLNLFVNHQVRTGRYAELYEKYFDGEPPQLTIDNVYR
ncbi:transporter substrate-binding domain-containing protein [Ensifer sp. Root127]|uniref:ABC transporter substrate-binding protein n=1 Tax=Ensifer sp. Root127 TaxID=1736440 RepID=UPI0012E3E2E5|nr:transporter substrate-binding domain-containing protein [Ensifer sp. Root127]